jgi:hypothetical protein
VPSEAPSASNASNWIVPEPSVQTTPACVGSDPSVAASNVKLMPAAPLPEKKEFPAVPEPSIAPSSSSTESVMLPGPNGAPADAATPGTFNSASSKSSRWK